MNVSILIVSYETRQLTLDCLRSVYEQTGQVGCEVVVVDNASQDGSAEAIMEQFPQTKLIRSPENLGFAAANNLAARQASGEWLLLVNPDTVVLDRAIDRLVGFAKRAATEYPQAGIFGGRTLFADGSLNPTCAWRRPTPWSMFCLGSGLASVFRTNRLFNSEAMPHWRRDTVHEVDIVTGCFFLLRRRTWERLGGFDPAFFMYGEEADFCLRARKQGIRGMICPDATIIHYGGASEKVRADKLVRLFTAKAQLLRRHWPAALVPFGTTMLSLWALSRMVVLALATLVSSDYDCDFQTWRVVWQARRRWRCCTPQVGAAVARGDGAAEGGCVS